MRIAVLGSRGVPATYSGVERHVEEVGARLAAAGHEVVVWCHAGRTDGAPASYRGMTLRYLPAMATKHLETVTHTALATARSLRGYDVLHYHAVGPTLFAGIPRVGSRAVIVATVHGLDSRRAKWGPVARRVLRTGEWTAGRVPHSTLVVSRTLARHYLDRYRVVTRLVPNGVDPPPASPSPETTVRGLGLAPGGYILFVGRLVPEKAPHQLIAAMRHLPATTQLVLVGGSAHTDEYVRALHSAAAGDRRIVFTGPLVGAALGDVYRQAAVFASASELEAAAPLTVLEAASCGVPVVLSDIPEHREDVAASTAGWRLTDPADPAAFAATLRAALDDLPGERAGLARLLPQLRADHDWDVSARLTMDAYRAALDR